MGKLAKNEMVKLRAAFFNNVAVGLLVGGSLIPYLVVTQHLGVITERLAHWHSITTMDVQTVIGYVVAFFLALTGAKGMRRHADAIIVTLKDDEENSN